MDFHSDLHCFTGNYLDYENGQDVASFNIFTAKDLDFLDEDYTVGDTEARLMSPSSEDNSEHFKEKELIQHIVEEQVLHLYDNTDYQCGQDWENYFTKKTFSPSQLSCLYCQFKCSSSTKLTYHVMNFHQSQRQVSPAMSDILLLSPVGQLNLRVTANAVVYERVARAMIVLVMTTSTDLVIPDRRCEDLKP